MYYVGLQRRPTGVVFDYITNTGYVLLEGASFVSHVNLESVALKQASFSTVTNTTPVHCRTSTTDVPAHVCAFDPYRQKLVLVSTVSGSVQIVNTQTGLLELYDANLSISPYDETLLDAERGFAYVLEGGRYIRIYSTESSALVSRVDTGLTNVKWMRFGPNKNTILLLNVGNPASLLAYDVQRGSLASWTSATVRASASRSTMLYVPSQNVVALVRDDNRLAFVSPTSSTIVDNNVTADLPQLFLAQEMLLLVSSNTVKLYDLSGNVLDVKTLLSNALHSAFDLARRILVVSTASLLYVFEVAQNGLELVGTAPITTGSFYGVFLDPIFSRAYVLESTANRLFVYEYTQKLLVFLDVKRGATEWTGFRFNDQLTIEVKTTSGEPVGGAVCEVKVIGNALLNVSGELTRSATFLTNEEGKASCVITVTGPGSYVVSVEARK